MTEPRSRARETAPPREDEEERAEDLLASLPGFLRLAVAGYVRTLGWGLKAGVGAGNTALRVLLNGRADTLLSGVSDQVREQLRHLVGVTEIEQRLGRMPEPPPPPGELNGDGRADHLAMLKERGAELLARSAGVEDGEVCHPAYERVLTSLAPDEARILRLIAIEGPRAAVDVRTWRPLDVGSETIEPGLSMIGHEAGCRHLDRIPAYLSNLFRLGLIWFNHEPLPDQSSYQVLEAQPDVQEAMTREGRAKTMRRSVDMTPFGKDFCEVCLPLDTAGFLALKDERRR